MTTESDFVQAVGLATTSIDMEIDVSDPIGMMKQIVAEVDRLRRSEEMAWGLIANAFEGNWGRAPLEWGAAARRWRDEYHKHLPPTHSAKEEELATEGVSQFDYPTKRELT
jgi:hypothetical protein